MLIQKLTALFSFSLKKKQNVFEELYEYFTEKYFSEDLGRYDNFEFGTGKLISYNMIIIAIFAGIIVASALAIYNKRYLGNLVRKIISDGALSPDRAKSVEELGFKNNFMIKLSLAGGKTFGRMIRCVEADQYYASMLGENSAFPPAPPKNEDDKANRGRGFDENSDENGENTPFDENRGRGEEQNDNTSGESPEARHDRLLRGIKPYRINILTDRFYIREEDKYAAELRYAKKGTNWLVFAFVVILCIILAGLVCYLIPDMLQLVDNFLTEVKK
jgi:hypothetical protein